MELAKLKSLFFFFLFALQIIYAKEKTICLNMIVKNEKDVIQNCLSSVKNIIDYWVICDTGSTDGTQDIIKKTLKNIPGTFYEKPWVDFGHNRNEALQLAKDKAEYILFLDADEILQGIEHINKKTLDRDIYYANLFDQKFRARRVLLIKNGHDWKWEGVLHERLVCNEPLKRQAFEEVVINTESKKGARSKDVDKHIKDLFLLEKLVQDNPDNSRYVYYLALGYLNLFRYEQAFQAFEKRAKMGKDQQEVFFSLYAMADIENNYFKKPKNVVLDSYMKAFKSRPVRAEPLYRMSVIYFEQGNYILGYSLAKQAFLMKCPIDQNLVEHWIYNYGIAFSIANNAFKLGKFEEAAKMYKYILERKKVPDRVSNKVKNYLTLSLAELKKQKES